MVSAQVNWNDEHFFVMDTSMVYFEYDEDIPIRFPAELFVRLSSQMRTFPESIIRLEGRADIRGTNEYNKDLAARRCSSVVEFLVNKGFPSNRFEIVAYGDENPLADNETEEGMQENRSVLIQFGHKMPMRTLTGQLKTYDTKRPVTAILYVQGRYYIDTLHIDGNGKFSMDVPGAGILSLEAYGRDYILEKTMINPARTGYDLGIVELKRIETGDVYNFSDLLFISNQAILMDGFDKLLSRVSALIVQNPHFRFEIQGHVHWPHGTKQMEGTAMYLLSENRAKFIYDYLLSEGVTPERMEWKAYSNWHMIYPNAQEEDEARHNRRVSIKVLEYFNGEPKN